MEYVFEVNKIIKTKHIYTVDGYGSVRNVMNGFIRNTRLIIIPVKPYFIIACYSDDF